MRIRPDVDGLQQAKLQQEVRPSVFGELGTESQIGVRHLQNRHAKIHCRSHQQIDARKAWSYGTTSQGSLKAIYAVSRAVEE